MRRTLLALGMLCAVWLSVPGTARANGDNSHFWISLEALQRLPEGRLKDLLTDPAAKRILLNGAVFPDAGYAIGDDYGETAHWEPFLEGYLRWIRRNFDPPYDRGNAAAHVIFLMGVASHDMADQVFDYLFMRVAEVEDASGWGDGLLDSLDTATDVLLVADTGLNEPLEPEVPADALAEVFAEEVGYDVQASLLTDGQEFLEWALQYPRDTGLGDPDRVQEYREQYPWAAAHLLDDREPGAPPCEATVVAAYWRALWDRLHGVVNPENRILATSPADTSAGHPTDHTHPSAQVGVVFGHGVDLETLSITVTTPGGDALPTELHVRGGQWGNFARLDPVDDWPADTTLTVTVAGGQTTIDDIVYDGDWSFTFSTAAGEAGTPCTDPTPNTSNPGASEAGGCQTTPASGGPFVWIALILVWSGRRRRAAGRRSSRRDQQPG